MSPLTSKSHAYSHGRLSLEMYSGGAYEAFFLVSYGIWLVAVLLQTTFFAASLGMGILFLFRCVGLAGALLSVLLSGNNRASQVFWLFLLVVLAFITTRTNAPVFLDTVILIYCGRLVDFEKIAWESLWTTVLISIVTIISAEVGLIQNYVDITSSAGVIRQRQYLGFLYALQPAQLIFNISCIAVYLKKSRFTPIWALLLFIVNLYVYMKTDSRLSFYSSVILIIFALVLSWRPGKRILGEFLRFATPLSFIACFALCWYMVSDYSGAGYSELNTFLNGRLGLGQRALAQYGTTLFGQNIDFIGNGLGVDGKLNVSGAYNYVDCLYVRLPILYGWVFTVLFMTGMTFLSLWAARKRDYALLLVLIAIAFHGVIDDLTIRLQSCTFLFLLGTYVSEAIGEKSVKGMLRMQE